MRITRHSMLSCAAALGLTLGAARAEAVTYEVGPSRRYTNLGAVAGLVSPGDLVLVDGGATYPSVRFTRAGTVAAPIVVRGVRSAAGARPVLEGGANTIELAGSNYVFEGFEVRAGMRRCVYHHADNVVIRDAVVHDCPAQGILGADQGSGDLLLEYVEVYRCGGGSFDHQIYMATDEVAFPGSVFRMQFCYVHSATGGNAVKSRAERNEIYYNWIEGALYHELELIGPDPDGAPAGWSERLAREDSDVVGNVLRATGTFPIVRVGGDGTGQSLGRYRFVNNTFVSNMGGGAVMRVFTGIESIEMHNNVFYATAGTVNVSRTTEAMWVAGEIFEGDNNWVPTDAMNVPRGFRRSITGASPMLVDAPRFNYTPAMGSPLVDRGVMTTVSPMGRAFARPLALPRFHPPMRRALAPGAATARPSNAVIDLGAFESGPAAPRPDVPTVDATADVPPRVDIGARDVTVDTGARDVGVDTGARDAGVTMDVAPPRDVSRADTGARPDVRPLLDVVTTDDVIAAPDVPVIDVAAADVGAPPDDLGNVADAPTPVDAAIDDAAPDDAATTVDALDDVAPTDVSAPPTPPPAEGCGCATPGAATPARASFAVAAALVACAFRRRRARRA